MLSNRIKKDFADKQQKIRNINSHINELKKKNPADLTPDEVELINNQNDFLRSEIQKRDESISALSGKIGAKFVPFDIFPRTNYSLLLPSYPKLTYRLSRKATRSISPITRRKPPPLLPRLFVRSEPRV